MSQPRVTPEMLAVVASPAPISMADLFGGQPHVALNPSEALRGLLPGDCREYFLVFAPGGVAVVGVAGGEDGYLDAWGIEVHPVTGRVRGRDRLLAEAGEGQVVQYWDRLPSPGAWVTPEVSFAARKAAAEFAKAKAEAEAERAEAERAKAAKAKAKARAEAERRSHLLEVGREARRSTLSGKAAKIPAKIAAQLAAAEGGKRK